MTWFVLVCPDKYCRGISISDKQYDSFMCRTCNSQFSFEKYKISYEAEAREEAVAARTKLMSKLDDDAPSWDELVEQGALEEPDRVFQYGQDYEEKSDIEIVQDGIDQADSGCKEDIIEYALDRGVHGEKTVEILERLTYAGELMDFGDKVERL